MLHPGSFRYAKACLHYPKPSKAACADRVRSTAKGRRAAARFLQDLPPVLFQRHYARYPLQAHIRSRPTARCCSQTNPAFRVSSVSRLHRILCRLHGSQDKDIRIFQTVLSLLLHGGHFEAPILRSAVPHRLTAFQSVRPFFRHTAARSTFRFHFSCRQQCCGQAAVRAAYRSRLKYHRCFSLFAADGRCRTAPAHGTRSEPRALHDLSASRQACR